MESANDEDNAPLTALETALWLREVGLPVRTTGGRLAFARGLCPDWLKERCARHNDEIVRLHAQHLHARFAHITQHLTAHHDGPALKEAATVPVEIVTRYNELVARGESTDKVRRRLSRGHAPAGHDVVAAALLHGLGLIVRGLAAIERQDDAFLAGAEATLWAVQMGWTRPGVACPLLGEGAS